MFSMFGQTGAPTKRGPSQKDKQFFFILQFTVCFRKAGLKLPVSCCCCNSSVHCSTGPQQNVDDDYCACRVKAGGLRGIHKLWTPTFFLNRGPAWSKSAPGCTTLIDDFIDFYIVSWKSMYITKTAPRLTLECLSLFVRH